MFRSTLAAELSKGEEDLLKKITPHVYSANFLPHQMEFPLYQMQLYAQRVPDRSQQEIYGSEEV